MPAFKVATIGTGKGSRADAAHRSALPEAVVDVGKFGFPAARICGRLSDGNAPRGGWDLVAGGQEEMREQHDEGQREELMSSFHEVRNADLR
jgi:hypothetical protein